MGVSGRPLLPWHPRARSDEAAAVRPLTPGDVAALRLPWSSRFHPESLRKHVTRFPTYAWALPEAGEYLVAEPWRRRPDLAMMLELHSRSGREALVTRALADLAATGHRALLLADSEWGQASRFYREHGFALLEHIVYYQLLGLSGPPAATRPLPPLEFSPITAHHLPTVLAIDHAAFPWMWWNSETEFQTYVGTAGVQIWLGWTAGVPVAYAGFTTLDRWGHLDRLAVDPAWHGRGYGAAMLAFALGRMAALGINRVTLSTQVTNTDSQRLYTGFGFRQTTETYDLYGRWLGEQRP